MIVKNPIEVLRVKEQEILKLRVQIEALKITAQLLSDDGLASQISAKPESRHLVEMP